MRRFISLARRMGLRIAEVIQQLWKYRKHGNLPEFREPYIFAGLWVTGITLGCLFLLASALVSEGATDLMALAVMFLFCAVAMFWCCARSLRLCLKPVHEPRAVLFSHRDVHHAPPALDKEEVIEDIPESPEHLFARSSCAHK